MRLAGGKSCHTGVPSPLPPGVAGDGGDQNSDQNVSSSTYVNPRGASPGELAWGTLGNLFWPYPVLFDGRLYAKTTKGDLSCLKFE